MMKMQEKMYTFYRKSGTERDIYLMRGYGEIFWLAKNKYKNGRNDF